MIKSDEIRIKMRKGKQIRKDGAEERARDQQKETQTDTEKRRKCMKKKKDRNKDKRKRNTHTERERERAGKVRYIEMREQNVTYLSLLI